MNRGRWKAWVALAVPILAWGLSFPSIKAALTEFPPMTLALGRFVLASAFLGLVNLARRKAELRTKWTNRDKGALLLSVLTGITAYFLCENHGVKLIPATAASLIIAGIPILTLIAERLVHGTRLGLLGIAAAVVSLAGVGLLSGVSGSEDSGNVWGYVLMLGAAGSWVLYLFAMKPLQNGHSNLQVTFWQMTVGALSLVPFALAELPDWRWPSVAGWSHLAFQGLVCSASSYLLYNYALNKLGRGAASLAVNLIPVVTAAAAYVLLGELLGPWQWAGGALVLVAVLAVGIKDTLSSRPDSL
ncbi:MAG: DMT family transporter [Spirochaetales bacterium]